MLLRWENIPSSKKVLRCRLQQVIQARGIYPIPTGGCGKQGKELEEIVGFPLGGNKRSADVLGLEIKTYRGGAPITLFHLECDKREINGKPAMLALVDRYGRLDKKGRLSLREIIYNKSDLFRLLYKKHSLVCEPNDSAAEMYAIRWNENGVIKAALRKLSEVLLVRVKVFNNHEGVRCVQYLDYMELGDIVDGPEFLSRVISGVVALDLDARQSAMGSSTLRNHGTKFRVPLKSIHLVWGRVDKWVPTHNQ